MKLAVAITLDGLIRALRWNVHDLAEAVEDGKPAAAGEKPGRRAPGTKREENDELTRR